ncbi:zinc metalloprotease HtpX [Candidatus Contubernalis alkaliaceticus]|uniref:zinc metalloprotease HtpX n=1 Tax=Candidatus Contubernalis alkaliaceticus TaxID=338645 RepID=UPI001F4C35FE|nr:zinc metalloprotease HtpX [Candidatus Contubernalis alkalaceticus]UNC91794.1 zinc metalloprotease HtpX [Candidatus Contubernalis alkalaceticus]
MNQLKTFFLMTVLTVVFVVLGGAIAGEQGLYIAFFLAVALNFMAYWFSDRMAIAMTRSKPLKQSEAPELYEMVKRLSRDANMPMPRIYSMPTDQPNAFATGRNPNNAVISVTDGLRRLLSRDEIEGVLAHELAHIKNRDILISSIAAVMAGALTIIARMGMWQNMLGGGRRRQGGGAAVVLQLVAIVLAPIAALLIRMAISRSMEYHADATAAKITGRPENLANALLRLQSGAQHRPYPVNEAASHMFIINPLSGNRASMANLFSTHPPIEDRVRRLLGR